VAEEFKGKDFLISIEINPHLTKAEDMIAHAKELSQIAENFVIKVPCNEQGLIAAKKLEEQHVRTNVYSFSLRHRHYKYLFPISC
jgi:transaldolase